MIAWYGVRYHDSREEGECVSRGEEEDMRREERYVRDKGEEYTRIR